MLGSRIRALRQALGITIRQAAEQAGISPGSLSQIERGIINPSLVTLRNIAKVLKVPPYYLLIESTENALLVRKGDRGKLAGSDDGIELITSGFQPAFEMLSITLSPGQSIGDRDTDYSVGESTVVIRGRVQVQVGDQTYELEEGDSIYIPAGLPHNMTNIGSDTAVTINTVEKRPMG